jgi:cell division protein ZapA
MNPNKDMIQIQLLGKAYAMACPPEETQRLKEAAQCLDQKIRTLSAAHRTLPIERVVMMVALELSHELLALRSESRDYKETLETKVRALTAVLDEV